jgi:MFS family permease
MGVLLFVAMLPKVLFLLVGGVIADRLPRHLILFFSDAGRAVVVLLLSLLGWLHLLQFWHLVMLSLFFGIVDSFFAPAYQAIPPQLVRAENLASANALTNLSQQIGFLAGPGLGAALVTLAGPASAFAFDGITFVVSTLCLLAMFRVLRLLHRAAIQRRDTSSTYEAGLRVHLRTMLGDVREGLLYVKNSTWLWVTILIASVVNIGFAGAQQVVLPKLIQNVYHGGVWLLGTLIVAGACGAIVANLIIGQMQKLRRRGLIAYSALLLSSAALVLFGLPLPAASLSVVACIANVLVDFGIGVFGIIWITLLQELIPEEKLGRVSSIEMTGSYALLPVGYILMGLLADSLGSNWAFVIGGCLNLAFVGVGLCIREIRLI